MAVSRDLQVGLLLLGHGSTAAAAAAWRVCVATLCAAAAGGSGGAGAEAFLFLLGRGDDHLCGCVREAEAPRLEPRLPAACRKTVFLRCYLYRKTNILPRQARDKHRESTQACLGKTIGSSMTWHRKKTRCLTALLVLATAEDGHVATDTRHTCRKPHSFFSEARCLSRGCLGKLTVSSHVCLEPVFVQ
eukprot:COSAG06_NODE_15443_length_1070_cov_2.222451_2_plen_189_part_00